MRSVVLIMGGLLVLVGLAGCVNSGSDVEPGGEGLGADAGEGGGSEAGGARIVGKVMSLDFQEVKGATVRLMQDSEWLRNTTTAENGTYSFTGLESGLYRLVFSSFCCREEVRGAEVGEGQAVRMDVLLEPLPSMEPFVQRESWTGLVGCSGYVPGYGVLFNPYGICAETDPNNDPVLEFDVEPGLKTIVVAMEWDQVAGNLLEDLRLILAKEGSLAQSSRFFTLEGPSPLEVTVGEEDAEGGEELYFDQIDEPWELRFTVTAATSGNVVYQQPFTVHYDLYYWGEAPEGASALPE